LLVVGLDHGTFLVVLKGFNGVKHGGAYLISRLGLEHGGDASLEGYNLFFCFQIVKRRVMNRLVAHGNGAGLQSTLDRDFMFQRMFLRLIGRGGRRITRILSLVAVIDVVQTRIVLVTALST
jgi:hypothetical protein